MRIHKCDACGKVLNQKLDRFYSVPDISFHNPGDSIVRLILDKQGDNEKSDIHKNLESWTNYCDLDFCETCFGKLLIKKFL